MSFFLGDGWKGSADIGAMLPFTMSAPYHTPNFLCSCSVTLMKISLPLPYNGNLNADMLKDLEQILLDILGMPLVTEPFLTLSSNYYSSHCRHVKDSSYIKHYRLTSEHLATYLT